MFIKDYDINKMSPADYNPRKIKEGAFEKLKDSLLRFGVVKPVIINQNGILVAGHQRTKAMKAVGIKSAPVFFLKKHISVADEIKFNLMHNSIETETSKVVVTSIDNLEFGFQFVEPEHFKIIEKASSAYSSEISKLMSKYGDFSGVICDETGRVIHNSDYAFISKVFNKKCLVYKMENQKAEQFLEFMTVDYGSYNYESLNIKPYVQTHCQMSRSETNMKSTTYEKHVIPNIKKEQRGIDFGAGKRFYQQHLASKGYNLIAYEPFPKATGSEKLDLKAVINMIDILSDSVDSDGLFDYVVLDSVLNSVSSDDYEDAILKSCNALLSDNGTFYTGTRALVTSRLKSKKKTDKTRYIEFLDENNYSATFRKGVWTLQKFHTLASLKELLSKYFLEVEVFGRDDTTQIWAKCKKPIRFEKKFYVEALNKEFNIEYPNDYRHNKHEKVIESILTALGF